MLDFGPGAPPGNPQVIHIEKKSGGMPGGNFEGLKPARVLCELLEIVPVEPGGALGDLYVEGFVIVFQKGRQNGIGGGPAFRLERKQATASPHEEEMA